jgi:hypothetical protein
VGLLLIILGLILWLALGWQLIGIILVVLGLVLLFVPWDGAYGYHHYRGP